MGIEQVRDYLQDWDMAGNILEFEVSSATVELAALALNTEEARIAKTLSFLVENKAILIVTTGEVKIDNKKFKQEFGCKAKMLSFDMVHDMIGHEVGGVCPFGVKEGVDIYLDVSLQNYDFIYPACGSANSAIKLTHEQLYDISKAKKWVDVCKLK
ncbi:MAG: YbaK/EbsC family protein [Sulfurospirillaceae bacterium]|nr:YbaK/EbsC family protein [Sulfurospirillaceae bacterium]